MIVISDALALALASDPDADNWLIGYENLVTVANVTTSVAAATGYPATNLANPATYRKWVAGDTTEQYVTVEVDRVDPIDYVAIARHNLGTIGISVSVEGQATDGGAWSELVEPAILANDSPALFRFEETSLFAVRLKLTSGSTAAEIAVLYTGALLVGEWRIWAGHTPLTDAEITETQTARSESGEFLGRIITGGERRSSVPLQYVSKAWWNSYFRPFALSARAAPFFFAWRPATYSAEVGFAWLTADPIPSQPDGAGFIECELNLGAIAL